MLGLRHRLVRVTNSITFFLNRHVITPIRAKSTKDLETLRANDEIEAWKKVNCTAGLSGFEPTPL